TLDRAIVYSLGMTSDNRPWVSLNIDLLNTDPPPTPATATKTTIVEEIKPTPTGTFMDDPKYPECWSKWGKSGLTAEHYRQFMKACEEKAASAVIDFAGSSRHSGPDCLQQWSDIDDPDHPLHVVGQNVEAHLGTDPLQRPGQEVRTPHPRFEGSERVRLPRNG